MFEKKGTGLKEQTELENLLLGCDKDMVRPQEVTVRMALKIHYIHSQRGEQHRELSGVPSAVSSRHPAACSSELRHEGPLFPHL